MPEPVVPVPELPEPDVPLPELCLLRRCDELRRRAAAAASTNRSCRFRCRSCRCRSCRSLPVLPVCRSCCRSCRCRCRPSSTRWCPSSRCRCCPCCLPCRAATARAVEAAAGRRALGDQDRTSSRGGVRGRAAQRQGQNCHRDHGAPPLLFAIRSGATCGHRTGWPMRGDPKNQASPVVSARQPDGRGAPQIADRRGALGFVDPLSGWKRGRARQRSQPPHVVGQTVQRARHGRCVRCVRSRLRAPSRRGSGAAGHAASSSATRSSASAAWRISATPSARSAGCGARSAFIAISTAPNRRPAVASGITVRRRFDRLRRLLGVHDHRFRRQQLHHFADHVVQDRAARAQRQPALPPARRRDRPAARARHRPVRASQPLRRSPCPGHQPAAGGGVDPGGCLRFSRRKARHYSCITSNKVIERWSFGGRTSRGNPGNRGNSAPLQRASSVMTIDFETG